MSPSRSAAEGARKDAHKKERLFRVLWVNGLSKPTDNVGQQAKDNWQDLNCQRCIFTSIIN